MQGLGARRVRPRPMGYTERMPVVRTHGSNTDRLDPKLLAFLEQQEHEQEIMRVLDSKPKEAKRKSQVRGTHPHPRHGTHAHACHPDCHSQFTPSVRCTFLKMAHLNPPLYLFGCMLNCCMLSVPSELYCGDLQRAWCVSHTTRESMDACSCHAHTHIRPHNTGGRWDLGPASAQHH